MAQKNIEDCVFIIQARKKSQRVKNKMLRKFGDKSLIEIAIEKIIESKFIPKNQFYLSVYDEELINIGKKYDLNIFYRSKHSTETETDVKSLYEWHNKLNYKYVIFINPCSPFLKLETIEEFTKKYLEIKQNGFFGVIAKKNYFWNENEEFITPWPEGFTFMNTKYVSKTYEAAHCLYASRLDSISNNIFMGDFNTKGSIKLFPLSEDECLDVDYEWQFDLAESHYMRLNNIK